MLYKKYIKVFERFKQQEERIENIVFYCALCMF